jgi:hypothetical protein
MTSQVTEDRENRQGGLTALSTIVPPRDPTHLGPALQPNRRERLIVPIAVVRLPDKEGCLDLVRTWGTLLDRYEEVVGSRV